ncbi:glycosyltransferase family 4 protein [Limnochorda pilosa]|nr:glycosyltransferase family 4 protein [Limnochorda pilosa]
MTGLRRLALRLVDSVVTYGHLASQQVIGLGFDPARVVTGTNTVNTETLACLVHRRRGQLTTEGAVQETRFLYVGQFIERKGVRELLRIFTDASPSLGRLTLVGYGSLEAELRSMASHGDVNVRFAGSSRTLEELAEHYAQADVLVMPSLLEVWGLVVNEALAAGLYVLASKRAGATHDLIELAPTDVGRAFDPDDEVDFRRALTHATERVRAGLDRESITAWGKAHTPATYAAKIWEALALAREAHNARVSRAFQS